MVEVTSKDAALAGLSELQRFMLALAQFRRINAARDIGEHPHLYAHEVVALRWGFPTKDGQRLEVWTKRTPTRPSLPKARLGKRYQAARVAVSKALKRLEHRGLVQRGRYLSPCGERYRGAMLTPPGIAVAQQALAQYREAWEAAYWQDLDTTHPTAGTRG